ncbi:MAG: hypothetical protein KDE49_11195 [Novosphingobium sp.]|nr:hypothetical protein [Novosphingobium sp.]
MMNKNDPQRLVQPSTLLFLFSAVACLSLNVGEAQANTRGNLVVSLSGKGESNRFLIDEGNTASLAVSVLVQPSVTIDDQTTRFDLDGSVRIDQYTKHYGRSETIAANMNAQTRAGQHTILAAGARFSSSSDGFQDALLSSSGVLLDVPETQLPAIGLPDVSAAGLQERIDTFSAHAQLDHVFSPRDRVGIVAYGTLENDRRLEGNDFSDLGFQFSFTRQLSAQTSLLTVAGYSRVDFRGQEVGDGSIFTSLIGIDQKLSENLNLKAQAGIVYTNLARLEGGRDKKVGLAIDLSLCDRTSRRGICVSAARNALPTSFGGVTTSSAIAATYDQQISRNTRILVSGQYTRSNSIIEISSPNSVDARETFLALAKYSHDLFGRISLFISPKYARLERRSGARSTSNYSAELGISFSFGAK